nr:hypothetical protein [uncultured Lachnoanaerobaculum sp.]
MEFKKKKKSKKKLFIISIILLAVGVFAYFNKTTVCWALFIIGGMLFSNNGMTFIKEKLDKSKKERYMPTEATAFWISFIAYIIGVLAFVWMKEGEKKVEDTKPEVYYNTVLHSKSYDMNVTNNRGLEFIIGSEYYSFSYGEENPDKKKEWIDGVNSSLKDIVGDDKGGQE